MILQSTNPVIVNWDPPSPGWVKLNTDGSSLGNPGQSSYGGLIRNNNGCWVGGYVGNIGYNMSLTAEICGIMKGLYLVKEMGLKNVVIETDCQAALLLITVNKVDGYHPLRSLINDCKKCMLDLNCYMVHVKREGNRCADLMAKIGGVQECGFVYYKSPPCQLHSLLIEEAHRPNSCSLCWFKKRM